MSRRAPRTGPVGRRPLGADVRGELLQAGRDLLTEAGFQPIALREVADRAGVNQAMVRYYVRSKHGFLAALLDDGFDALITAISGHRSVGAISRAAIGALNTMPWLPVLLTQCVYLSAELREHFVRRHAPRFVGALRAALGPGRGERRKHAALVLLSALIFPQIARPVVSRVFQIQYDDRFATSFATELAALFRAPAARMGRSAPRRSPTPRVSRVRAAPGPRTGRVPRPDQHLERVRP
jgi:AcrR family transcriptional regulator